MEQRHKVRLSTSSTFDLEQSEIRRLYIYLSLFKYRHLRIPEYNEHKLYEALERDFKRYMVEMQVQCQREPNNLILNHIHTFFEMHYCKLKELTAEYKGADDDK